MRCLNKYLKMNLMENIRLIRYSFPHRFLVHDQEEKLPSRSVLTWLLARIQGFAALFYRIFVLTTTAGRYLMQRLRLGWGTIILLFVVGLCARIRAISQFLVLRAVRWHADIIPYVRTFGKSRNDPRKNFPQDLRLWLGGLDDFQTISKPKSTLDMVLAMVDLTEEEDLEIIKDFGAPNKHDDSIRTLYEMITLDDTPKKKIVKREFIEDIKEVIEICDVSSDNAAVKDGEEEDIGEVVEICDVSSGNDAVKDGEEEEDIEEEVEICEVIHGNDAVKEREDDEYSVDSIYITSSTKKNTDQRSEDFIPLTVSTKNSASESDASRRTNKITLSVYGNSMIQRYIDLSKHRIFKNRSMILPKVRMREFIGQFVAHGLIKKFSGTALISIGNDEIIQQYNTPTRNNQKWIKGMKKMLGLLLITFKSHFNRIIILTTPLGESQPPKLAKMHSEFIELARHFTERDKAMHLIEMHSAPRAYFRRYGKNPTLDNAGVEFIDKQIELICS